MTEEEDLYCQVFLDTFKPIDVVVSKIWEWVTGKVEGDTIIAPWGEIDVRNNQDYDLHRSDDFLHYRYYLDIYPKPSTMRFEYVMAISDLLLKIAGHGWSAVAACDFEDELPQNGNFS